MPARGSRAQLLRDLTAWYARVLSNYYDTHIHPGGYWGVFDDYSTDQLQGLAEEVRLEPPKRGRPPRYHLDNKKIVQQVEESMRSRTGRSARTACRIVSKRLRVSETALRARYNRARKLKR